VSERDFTPKDPVYESDVHSEVARECMETWRQGKPWTRIQVLRKGVDNPNGQSCGNSQGHFNQPCADQIEAVQYTSAQAVPMFFCERHALEQNGVDNALYWSTPDPVTEENDGPTGETVADQVKRHRKKNKELEPESEEEIDL
jgi:hypothetical protein